MIRRHLARALHLVSLWSGHGLRRAKAQAGPRILMYHGVGEAGPSPQAFAWQLALLRREFEVLSLPDLLSRRAAGRLNGPEVALTFDDGVRNHVSAAYPLLREFRVPATFFVCPGLIESGQWIWNMEMRCRLRLLSERERHALAEQLRSPGRGVEDIVRHAKQLDLPRRQQIQAKVNAATRQFSPSEQQVDRYAPATWEQLQQLDPAIITIGSHTLDHPILPTLPAAQLEVEIGGSRQALETRLQRPVDLFCYPNGDSDPRAQASVRRHYSAAVTTVPGVVTPADDNWLLPRIPAGHTQALFMRRLYRHSA